MKQLGQDFYFYIMKEFSGVSLMRLIGIRNEVSNMGHTKGARWCPQGIRREMHSRAYGPQKDQRSALPGAIVWPLPAFHPWRQKKVDMAGQLRSSMEDVKISISIVFSQEAVFNHKAASFLGPFHRRKGIAEPGTG